MMEGRYDCLCPFLLYIYAQLVMLAWSYPIRISRFLANGVGYLPASTGRTAHFLVKGEAQSYSEEVVYVL